MNLLLRLRSTQLGDRFQAALGWIRALIGSQQPNRDASNKASRWYITVYQAHSRNCGTIADHNARQNGAVGPDRYIAPDLNWAAPPLVASEFVAEQHAVITDYTIFTDAEQFGKEDIDHYHQADRRMRPDLYAQHAIEYIFEPKHRGVTGKLDHKRIFGDS